MKVTAEWFPAMPVDPIDTWRVGRGYRCPACGSDAVARERNETTRYPERVKDVERIIRCMDCGIDDQEGES